MLKGTPNARTYVVLLRRPVDDELAGEHAETPQVFLIVLADRQVPVEIKHRARLFSEQRAQG